MMPPAWAIMPHMARGAPGNGRIVSAEPTCDTRDKGKANRRPPLVMNKTRSAVPSGTAGPCGE